jgi:hypothetical protein
MQRKLFVVVIFFLFVSVFSFAIFAQGGGKSSSKAPPLDLNGTWKTEDGEEVKIDHNPQSGFVLTIFDSTPGQKIAGDCPNAGHRGKYIDGKMAGRSLSGTMWLCTTVKELIEGCHLDPVFTVTFKTTLVSSDLITGTRRSEWYGPKQNPAKSDTCKYVRDPSGDRDVPFTLTRKGVDCPDTSAIDTFNQITDRAAKFTDAAAKYVKDGEIGSALNKSQKALRDISNTISRLEKAGKKCKEIHETLSEIEQFQAAIDQINNAGCDSQALAGGFDNLFQAAGKIGKRFVKIPELQPLFEILSQNSNFFQKVSGALDPEHRWADQFAGIDGYVPNCPH